MISPGRVLPYRTPMTYRGFASIPAGLPVRSGSDCTTRRGTGRETRAETVCAERYPVDLTFRVAGSSQVAPGCVK
jgi:hypothetical protein